jgi:hypothetical protein
MSMAAASSNAFGFERHRARYESERAENGANTEKNAPTLASDESLAEADAGRDRSRVSEAEFGDEEEGGVAADVEEDNAQETVDTSTDGLNHYSARGTVSLGELEEARELERRRTNACVMLAVFVLFTLWVQAIQDGDFVELLLCLVATSWTARWIRHNREREEELDQRITNYLLYCEAPTIAYDPPALASSE